MTETRSITTKEAAALLRARLKRLYPAVRFSVRYERYSMGSHITVAWTDGPAQHVIEALAAAYSGARFDGATDSSYHLASWLLPNGSAVTAVHGAIGAADRGTLSEAPAARAELVHFHGSAPQCYRTISPDYEAKCAKAWSGLSARERGTLQQADRFPCWEGRSDGYKLAWYFDAAEILAQADSAG